MLILRLLVVIAYFTKCRFEEISLLLCSSHSLFGGPECDYELHAHLNISYSNDCMKELIALSGNTWEHANDELQLLESDYDKHFDFYTKIQKLVRTEGAVYLLTHSVITEFSEDNVKYLELRSTPKCHPETGMTYELYVRTMIRAIRDCEKEGHDIKVRLLPSIDRRLGLDVAKQTVELAEKLMHETNGLVIGIDFSGDPAKSNAEDYIPVLLDASRRGLKLALHLFELPLFEESKKVLEQCIPKSTIRIGHGTYIHRYDQDSAYSVVEDLVKENRIPIETCITSNILSKTVDSLDQHHFKYWYDKKHPVIICTDGKGVYGKTLTEEYMQAATAYGMTKEDLKEYVLSSIESIFESQSFKQSLKGKYQQIIRDMTHP